MCACPTAIRTQQKIPVNSSLILANRCIASDEIRKRVPSRAMPILSAWLAFCGARRYHCARGSSSGNSTTRKSMEEGIRGEEERRRSSLLCGRKESGRVKERKKRGRKGGESVDQREGRKERKIVEMIKVKAELIYYRPSGATRNENDLHPSRSISRSLRP
ncbi:hypothetical protein PUN28_017679 [Cardiocondyla obscurior]|uniref:Uncharacterized protein n=1 Tax=Cardiocondyla obscurior TaxID=286306 RepID=A0AAW2END7_9HYME